MVYNVLRKKKREIRSRVFRKRRRLSFQPNIHMFNRQPDMALDNGINARQAMVSKCSIEHALHARNIVKTPDAMGE